ncbi:MAG TPA: hypothetical protein VKU00_25645 [Chthonomonadaceae bacterium]|nr:hypothetical protein [Chthonomonadaceae bacterium]
MPEVPTFLDLLPSHYRGIMGHWFLTPIRDGETEPGSIVASVLRKLEEKRDEADTMHQTRQYDELRRIVLDNLEAAKAFAQERIAYEALPADVKAERKAQNRCEAIQQHMEGLPPTERQCAALRRLGDNRPVANRAEASKRIDALLSGRKVGQ